MFTLIIKNLHGARFGATTHSEKSSAHHRHLDGGGGFWFSFHVDEDAKLPSLDHDAARER